MEIREHDSGYESGAQNRESGPSWGWVLSGALFLVVVLSGTVFGIAQAQFSEVKADVTVQRQLLQQHDTAIVKLQTDLGYVKEAVTEIRNIVRSDF